MHGPPLLLAYVTCEIVCERRRSLLHSTSNPYSLEMHDILNFKKKGLLSTYHRITIVLIFALLYVISQKELNPTRVNSDTCDILQTHPLPLDAIW